MRLEGIGQASIPLAALNVAPSSDAASLSSLQFVPATSAATAAAAQTACGQVGGVWQANPPGCTMDVGSDGPPAWCSFWGMASLFPDSCTPLTAAQLAAYGNYTAYKTAQLSPGTYTPPGDSGPAPTGIDASAALVTANTAQSTALVSDCDYQSSLNYPSLSAMVGPSLTTMLTNPFANNPVCTDSGGELPGWMLYAGVAAVVILMVANRKK